jgi:hypothetical protein
MGRCRLRISVTALAILTTVLRDLPQSLQANSRILNQLKHNLSLSNFSVNSSSPMNTMVCNRLKVLALLSGMKCEHFIYLLIVGLAINRTCIVIPFPTKGTKHAIP